MIEVIHISPSYKPAYYYGGPTVSISRLCEVLAENQITVEVYTTTANGSRELNIVKNKPVNVEGVLCTYFRRITKDHSHFSPNLLLRLFKSNLKTKIVHIHSWWNLVSIPSVIICILLGNTPILSPRGMLTKYSLNSYYKYIFHNLFGKYILKRTILHLTSNQELKDVQSLVPNFTYFIAPNIIDLPSIKIEVNKTLPSKIKLKKMVFLSRIHQKKGLELFLESLSKIKFEFEFYIYGDGDLDYIDQLKSKSKQLNIDNKVFWKGWISGDDKFKVLLEADLFILTSFNENFANAALESLSVGTPVLLSNFVGISEYVSNKGFGSVCELTVDSICTSLNNLHDTGINLSRNEISKTVRRDFSYDVIINKYLEFYKKSYNSRFSDKNLH